MLEGLRGRLLHAWNAFQDQESTRFRSFGEHANFSSRPDRPRLRYSNERSILASILTRIAVDASGIDLRHIRRDSNGRYVSDVESGLNNCLTVEANIDQGARQYRQDVFTSLLDDGVIAMVPVDTSTNPALSTGYNILTMRVGEVVAWYPQHVTVRVFNQDKQVREDITLEKRFVGVVQNPLYSILNEQNSTLQRLIRKLNLLDAVDEQSSSGKLDIIIQLPYTIKSDTRRKAAEQRRIDMEAQLKGSKYGIAYSDATEKIVQLNRPAENNLLEQVKYLTEELYRELGITPEIMAGTADEKAMLNYYYRTIEPLIVAVVEAMRRNFLTKTARSQGQWIDYFWDRFRLVPIKDLAEIADKFTRSEVASSNDLRQVIGWKPSTDPKADELRNTNMPVPTEPIQTTEVEGNGQNGSS